jgi:hypothetical protein
MADMPFDPAFVTPGRFLKGNIHTHSTRSDGAKSPEQVCDLYKDAGYDFLALTDHFLERYGFPVVDTRRSRTPRFTTILGAEVHAPSTVFGELWHLLAVGLPIEFAQTAPSEGAQELARRCVEAGAFLAIAHPAWYSLTLEDARAIPQAHAVEIYNHTSEVKTGRGDGSVLFDQLLAEGRQISACATDDAHFHLEDFFGAWVMVRSGPEPEELVEALKGARYYSTQGPQIHDVTYNGDSVEVHCSPVSRIMLLGRASLAVHKQGVGLTRATLPLEPVRTGGFCRVVIVDAQNNKAWSNPAWL